MSAYVTTNIRIPKEMLKALKLRAIEEGKNVSQLIRESIQCLLTKEKEEEIEYEKDPLPS